jgi:hypothetical protein
VDDLYLGPRRRRGHPPVMRRPHGR